MTHTPLPILINSIVSLPEVGSERTKNRTKPETRVWLDSEMNSTNAVLLR
jgi:hypothetical protein